MFQRANSSLPRFAWRLYREKASRKGYMLATCLLFSEIVSSYNLKFQVAVMSHLWLESLSESQLWSASPLVLTGLGSHACGQHTVNLFHLVGFSIQNSLADKASEYYVCGP